MFDLFDKVVVPVLCYGSEVWGYERQERIERVHTKFCKRVLGVSNNTSNVAVLGECGRYPLFTVYFCKCIKYWLKMLRLPNNSLSKACYKLSKRFDESGRKTWCSKVRHLLNPYGFNEVWEAQGVANDEVFRNVFRQQVQD